MTNYAENRKLSGLFSGGLSFSGTADPSSVAAATAATEAFTVNGVKDGDVVLAFTLPLDVAIAAVHAEVTDNDEVTITFINPTAGALDPSSDTLTVWIARPEQPGPGVS